MIQPDRIMLKSAYDKSGSIVWLKGVYSSREQVGLPIWRFFLWVLNGGG
jgi:hypothetical protein